MNATDTRIYCDGSFNYISTVGGYGAVLVYKGKTREFNGAEAGATAAKMELMAAMVALRSIKSMDPIHVFSDSKYLVDGMNLHLGNWMHNGWRSAANKDIMHKQLWLELLSLTKRHVITWNWVKGHDGHIENERADILAKEAVMEYLSGGMNA